MSSIKSRRRHPGVIDGRSPAHTFERDKLSTPPKLPKLSTPGLAVQQGFNAGIIQAIDNALSALLEGSEEAAKYLQEAPQRSNDRFLCGQRWQAWQGKRDQLASSSTHGHQHKATSTIPQPLGCPRATPRQPPLNDFKLSPACTKNACVTWHPAPSPPQHPDALKSLAPFPTHCQLRSQIVARAIQYMLVTGCRVFLCFGGR